MKKVLLPLLALLLTMGCEKEQIVTADSEAEAELDFRTAGVDLKLWPPDGAYHTLTIAAMFPGLMGATIVIDEASSDELDDDPSSQDGSTTDDIVIAPDCQSIQLRRERMNAGNGRVYTISLSITDGSGTNPAEYIVAVPRWPWGWYSNAVDDGASYVVAGNCGGGGCSTDGLLAVTVNTSSETYTLYVHPEDQRTGLPASNGVQWGGFGTDIPGLDNKTSTAAALADFDGAANTPAIVDQLGAGDYAAKVCADLEYNGCDDWYLPASGELKAMYDQLGGTGNNNFDGYYYWSSTEVDAYYAWAQNFVGGVQFDGDESYVGGSCRCVRR